MPVGLDCMKSIEVPGITGDKYTMWLWMDKEENILKLRYRTVYYKVNVLEKFQDTPELTITLDESGQKSIVETNFGRIEVTTEGKV